MDQTPKPVTTFRPLADRVLVRPTPDQDRTAAGIIIPDANKSRPRRGVVIAVGEGALNTHTGLRISPRVRPGDRVVYGKYSGGELSLNGEELLVMREDEILGTEGEVVALDVDPADAAMVTGDTWTDEQRRERAEAGRPLLKTECRKPIDVPVAGGHVVSNYIFCRLDPGHTGPCSAGPWVEDPGVSTHTVEPVICRKGGSGPAPVPCSLNDGHDGLCVPYPPNPARPSTTIPVISQHNDSAIGGPESGPVDPLAFGGIEKR